MEGLLNWGIEVVLWFQQFIPALDLPFKALTFMGDEALCPFHDCSADGRLSRHCAGAAVSWIQFPWLIVEKGYPLLSGSMYPFRSVGRLANCFFHHGTGCPVAVYPVFAGGIMGWFGCSLVVCASEVGE